MRSLPVHAELLRRRLDELPRRSLLRLLLDAMSLWRQSAAGMGTAASFHAVLGMAGALLLGVVWDHSLSAWMALLAGGIALLGAARAFSHLRQGLNAYDPSGSMPLLFDPFLRTRVMGFAMLCAGGFVALGLLVSSVMLPALARRAGTHTLLAETVVLLALWSLGCALLGMLLAAMLRSMPDAPASPHAVRVASATSATAIGTVTVIIGLQLARATPASPESLAEAAIIAVLWTCLCTQGVLAAGALAAAIDRSGPRLVARARPVELRAPPSSTAAPPASIALARSHRLSGPRHARPSCIVLPFPGKRRPR
ncbi:SUI1 family translation initiation factor [Piscinibacter terrae]|uniref:Uncharacterized protein n=1 Tax=Piscinibacter terrae TaxID=2496871 RepID=A0A3N7HLE3_9BURK|nr:YihY/virulence factor BrkB family protein [Albitalea terrae]RQP22927.1 hypothetical protein DZC73_21320 [Albitalea terrae]